MSGETVRRSPSGAVAQVFRTFVIDLGNIVANVTLDSGDLAFPEAALGDTVEYSAPALNANLVNGGAWVQAAGVVRLRVGNVSVGAIDPASQSFFVVLTKKGVTL